MSAKVDDNFSGEIEEIAGDDKVVISYRGGKKEGKTRYISSSGKVLSEIEYKGDIIHGKVRQFYESGGILSEADYRAGKLHGNFVTYYENGVKQMEAGYVEGELQGISKTYDEFGDMLTESLYESGRRQGISKIYYPKAQGGGVYEYAEYDQGMLKNERLSFYPSGEVMSSTRYDKGRAQSYTKYYNKDGSERRDLI